MSIAAVLVLLSAASAGASSNGVASWGYNASGQLGNGTTTTISRVPGAVSGLSGVTAVSAGGEHSLALLSDGTVRAWGNNRLGQLGNGTTTGSKVPVAVPGLSGVVAVSAGKQFSLALLSNGTVMTWGTNEDGELGSGFKGTKSTAPVLVKGLSGVSAISAGGNFSLARLSNGTATAWGAGDEGQLGNGKKLKSTTPVAVKGLTEVVAVAAGGEHGLALLANGTVMSWGCNISLQLGIPTTYKVIKEEGEIFYEEEEQPENSAVPGAVPVNGVTAVAAGSEHSLALLGTGEVMAWGGNGSDQLGNGTQGGMTNVPSAVSGLGGVTAIAAGGQHTLALLSGGSVEAWGYNPDGQLGNGTNLNSPVPVASSDLSGVTAIAGGGVHSLSVGPPLATVTGVSPSAGAQTGGASVAISGVNLDLASAVHFGASPAGAFTIESPTTITATAPPGVGIVDVTITTAGGTSAPNATDKYTYVPPPAITKVTPKKAPAVGGTTVTIGGTGLAGATAVSFGATPAQSFTVNSSTSISAVSPPGTAGPVDISVTTPYGTSAITTTDVFKYELPTITSLTPNAGPGQGGTIVTVHGSGYAPGAGTTTFKFGKASATSVTCESTTTCTLTTPAGKAGVLDVRALVGKYKSLENPPADQFTYE
ncbi:MAG TPA: IPT/TIG domain-containing protein [Solirubrobacteraceae bacterium]|nr:IPT/TIG domain-containing protein [Solirubrobacteraceae bacterium]